MIESVAILNKSRKALKHNVMFISKLSKKYF